MASGLLDFIGGVAETLPQSYIEHQRRKREEDERKRDTLISLAQAGLKSPTFQGDPTIVLKHIGEIMGAKGKRLDQALSAFGGIFGQGPEISQAERGLQPGVPLEQQTRPRIVGENIPPTHRGAFRTPQEQTEYETQEAAKRAGAVAQAQLPSREEYATLQSDLRLREDKLKRETDIHNKLRLLDERERLRADRKRTEIASQLGVSVDDPRVQGFFDQFLDATIRLKQAQALTQEARPAQVEALTEKTKTETTAIPERVKQGAARVAQGGQRIAQGEERLRQGREGLDIRRQGLTLRGAGGTKEINAGERKSFEDAQARVDEIKNRSWKGPETERAAAVAKKKEEARSIAQEEADKLRAYGYQVEVGEDEGGWAYIKRGPVTGFGTVPGVPQAQAQAQMGGQADPRIGKRLRSKTTGKIGTVVGIRADGSPDMKWD